MVDILALLVQLEGLFELQTILINQINEASNSSRT